MRFSRGMTPWLLVPLMALAGCGPIPVDQAERVCLRDAQLAERPRGSVAIGAASGRGGDIDGFGRVELEIGSDFVLGRDPSAVFDRCVRRRSGQMPTRPLFDQPGWRG